MAVSLPGRLDRPASAGGRPAFPEGLPFVRPTVPNPRAVAQEIERILASGLLTNGPHVRALEEQAAEYLHVRHCVAVASCTAGLMLVLRAADLTGDVVLPSFTFAATAHAGRCRIGRDYANPGSYDCRFIGLNARMSEVHAAIALASLEGIDERIEWRNQLASRYQEALRDIPGIGFPLVTEGDRTTFK